MSFFAGRHTSVYSLNHYITCRLEARQALIYQLVLGLTGENGKYNYSKAVHVYPPFFDIPCSAKNYKIAPALTAILVLVRMRKPKPEKWDGGPKFVLNDKGEDILKFAPAPDPILGYANLPMFKVSGKRKTTGRKNTRCIRALNVEQVRDYAISSEGLMEPLQIDLVTTPDPYSWFSEYGLTIPAGASREDAQIFENCVVTGDTKHIPPIFMSYLTARGIPMTWLAGRDKAAQELFDHCDARERSILYGYAVHCSLCGVTPEYVKDALDNELYHAFADAAARDAAAYTSIVKRPGSDMWAPSKNTKAYQFAISFFSRQ